MVGRFDRTTLAHATRRGDRRSGVERRQRDRRWRSTPVLQDRRAGRERRNGLIDRREHLGASLRNAIQMLEAALAQPGLPADTRIALRAAVRRLYYAIGEVARGDEYLDAVPSPSRDGPPRD